MLLISISQRRHEWLTKTLLLASLLSISNFSLTQTNYTCRCVEFSCVVESITSYVIHWMYAWDYIRYIPHVRGSAGRKFRCRKSPIMSECFDIFFISLQKGLIMNNIQIRSYFKLNFHLLKEMI